MRPPMYSADDVVKILALREEGWTVKEICDVHEISVQTYYRWRERFGGMTEEEAPVLRERLLENARLKRKCLKTEKDIKALTEILDRVEEF